MASVCEACVWGPRRHQAWKQAGSPEGGTGIPTSCSSAPGVLVKNVRAWAASQAWGIGPWGGAQRLCSNEHPVLQAAQRFS